jgi:transcriptional regulator with XRE-family HTH domain
LATLLSPPKYDSTLGNFAGDLRSRVFQTLEEAGNHVGLTHSTISRYESGEIKPPLGYLACLARLIVESLRDTEAIEDYKRILLGEINKALEQYAGTPSLRNWDALKRSADDYLKNRVTKKTRRSDEAKASLQRPPRVPHFTGREAELAQLLEDLQPGRVVTLCGPGGIGKTALAAEAVWTLAPGDDPPERFPDGIIFHSFYNQPQTALALDQIAQSFGEESRPTPRDAVFRALTGRRALLVLDGTENADDLQAVLEVRGNCGVLVTSRRRQDALIRHYRKDITPLPISRSVTLLQAWGGTRASDEESAQQICELVGGLPLAIRIAGSYLASAEQNATEYLAWLGKTPLRALDHGKRQHESVSRLLQKSLDRINEDARQALAMTGLLAPAPFDLEVISAALEVPASKAGRLLGELANFSFLKRPEQRYEITHALVYTFARRYLTVPAEIARRLVLYYTNLAVEQSARGLRGYTRLQAEHSHILAIVHGCVDRGDWDMVQELAGVISRPGGYLDWADHLSERLNAVETGLEATQRSGRQRGESLFLSSLGDVYLSAGRSGQAGELYKRVLDVKYQVVCLTAGGRFPVAYVPDYRKLGLLARGAITTEHLDKCLEYLEGNLALSREPSVQGDMPDQQYDQLLECLEQFIHTVREIPTQSEEGGVQGDLRGQLELALYEHYDRLLAILLSDN